MVAPSITVAILAGGNSSRMQGVDKGLLEIQGRPMVEWIVFAIDAMRLPAGSAFHPRLERLIVANRNRTRYSAFARTIPDDHRTGPGPMAGIATALAACETDCMITVPVDCPWPPPSLVQRLVAHASPGRCHVAHDGQRRQPLFAIYRRDLASLAMDASRAGQGPADWQRSLGGIDVDFSDERSHFFNLNSADDIAACSRARHGHE